MIEGIDLAVSDGDSGDYDDDSWQVARGMTLLVSAGSGECGDGMRYTYDRQC